MSVQAFVPDDRTFELAVINEIDYEHTHDCPHCNHIGYARSQMTIGDVTAGLQGVLRVCGTCELSFLVMAYPVLPTDKPIFLDWTVRDPGSEHEDPDSYADAWMDWMGML